MYGYNYCLEQNSLSIDNLVCQVLVFKSWSSSSKYALKWDYGIIIEIENILKYETKYSGMKNLLSRKLAYDIIIGEIYSIFYFL